jgi:hypothetical protein
MLWLDLRVSTNIALYASLLAFTSEEAPGIDRPEIADLPAWSIAIRLGPMQPRNAAVRGCNSLRPNAKKILAA